ncbi:hypothetical protein ACP70R_046404 [Stipagrostis hirtigluma subsp. patula]
MDYLRKLCREVKSAATAAYDGARSVDASSAFRSAKSAAAWAYEKVVKAAVAVRQA